jgi:hypothetical protein
MIVASKFSKSVPQLSWQTVLSKTGFVEGTLKMGNHSLSESQATFGQTLVP